MSTCDPMLFKFSSIGSYHKSKAPNKISSGSCDNDNDVSNDNGSNNSDGRASTNSDIGRGSPKRVVNFGPNTNKGASIFNSS